MNDHSVELEFDGGYLSTKWICNAPDYSICQAEYDCGCEVCYSEIITYDGRPIHLTADHDVLHAGYFTKGYCRYQDWFEQYMSEEVLSGTITVSVEPIWEGESYRFEIGSIDR